MLAKICIDLNHLAEGVFMKLKKLIYNISGALGIIVMAVSFFVLQETVGVDLESSIKINDVGVTEKEISIVGLDLLPGENKEYGINLLEGDSLSFDITFGFDPKGNDTLKEYLNVEVTIGDISITKTMTEAFDEGFIFRGINEEEKIVINYFMPENVGNEAQNKEISFSLNIKILIELIAK